MTGYTINKIQDEMTAAGSHWWNKSNMRFFRCRVSEKVYQGEGGVFFVTSEQPPSGERAYSVRQYKPETKEVDTVGDFCALTRAQAYREAAKLAGPASIVVEEAHREPTEAEQLTLDIQRGGGRCGSLTANLLIRLATKHQRMMVAWCNGEEMFGDDEEPLPKLAILRGAIEQAAKQCRCGVKLGGDPRGCTTKLILPNGETNDWGKEGWCVPTHN